MQQEHIDEVSTHIPLKRECGFYEVYIKQLMDSVLIRTFIHINVGVIVKAHSAMTMRTKLNEGEIFEDIHLTAEDENSSDEFIKKYLEKYRKEPNFLTEIDIQKLIKIITMRGIVKCRIR